MKCEIKSCSSENGKILSGISKKNGKPWKGFKCNDCDHMTFVPGYGGAEKQTQQEGNHQLTELIDLQKEANKLLAMIASFQTNKIQVTKDELKPDDEIPF